MSDLIPTTADVRDAYSSESSDSTYANRMFDLWLAKYKAKVVAKSEERIIKLLEGDAGQQIMCLDCSQELIALIKGEQK